MRRRLTALVTATLLALGLFGTAAAGPPVIEPPPTERQVCTLAMKAGAALTWDGESCVPRALDP